MTDRALWSSSLGFVATSCFVQHVFAMTIEHLRDGKICEPERLASYVLGMCRTVVLDVKRGRLRRERALRRFADDFVHTPSGHD
jgi:hypothetical protein